MRRRGPQNELDKEPLPLVSRWATKADLLAMKKDPCAVFLSGVSHGTTSVQVERLLHTAVYPDGDSPSAGLAQKLDSMHTGSLFPARMDWHPVVYNMKHAGRVPESGNESFKLTFPSFEIASLFVLGVKEDPSLLPAEMRGWVMCYHKCRALQWYETIPHERPERPWLAPTPDEHLRHNSSQSSCVVLRPALFPHVPPPPPPSRTLRTGRPQTPERQRTSRIRLTPAASARRSRSRTEPSRRGRSRRRRRAGTPDEATQV